MKLPSENLDEPRLRQKVSELGKNPGLELKILRQRPSFRCILCDKQFIFGHGGDDYYHRAGAGASALTHRTRMSVAKMADGPSNAKFAVQHVEAGGGGHRP